MNKKERICEFGINTKLPLSIIWLEEYQHHIRRKKETSSSTMQYFLFHSTNNNNNNNKGSNTEDIENFIDSRLLDKAQFRTFKGNDLKQHKRDYPFIKCDLIIIHNNENNDKDDDNGGGDTIHTKYQDIDLFTHDMKNKTIFLEINTFTNGTLIGKERFYKLS